MRRKREPSLEEQVEDLAKLWEGRARKVERGAKKVYKGYKKARKEISKRNGSKLKGFFKKKGKGPLYD